MKTKTVSPFIINFIFVIGLISALLFRLIIIVNYFDSGLSRIIWYCAVSGYLVFFGFRYYISHKRRKTIILNDLTKKVLKSDINSHDKDEIVYILNSILRSKEMFNYIFIFAVSIVAIIMDIVATMYIK